MAEWSKEKYEASTSSRCWWCTGLGDGWAAVLADPDMKGIVALEEAAGPIPEWAAKIVESSINFLPPCGHYLFPRAHVEAIGAVGSECAPQDLVHGCYTVERERKVQTQDYCLCLDAWLAGAKPEGVALELSNLGREVDWETVCGDLWDVLGEHTEEKELLVARLLHHLRWWIKFTVWDSDWASQFGRDEYLGEYSPSGGLPGEHYYFGQPVPRLEQQASPRIQKMEARLPLGVPPPFGMAGRRGKAREIVGLSLSVRGRMSVQIEMLRAGPENIERVSIILCEAATHLESIGQSLWPHDELSADAVADDVRSGIYFVAMMRGEAVGVLKYKLEDAVVWPGIAPGSSAYVHRLAVRRKVAGTGVSSHMLNWAKARTRRMGRKFLRLDCALRPKVCAIYEKNGFTRHSERQVGPYHVARYECKVENCG